MNPSRRTAQQGLGLVELLISTALASLLLGSLASVTLGSVQSQTTIRDGNEMIYQARFAMGRVVAMAEASAPKRLLPPPANTTGDWFSPTMFCLRPTLGQLIETTSADTGCTGSRVIADNVSAFSVQLPAGTGALDRPVASISLTATDLRGTRTITLATSARLGASTP